MSRTSYLAIGVALLVGACSSSTDSTAEFQEALQAVRAENQRHASGCAQSASMSDMAAEMQRHAEAMVGLLDELTSDFSQLGRCYAGAPLGMQDMMSGMHSEMAAHSARMQQCQDLDQAIDQCLSYARDTRSELDEMGSMMSAQGMGCMK
jgi:hypothetical protein